MNRPRLEDVTLSDLIVQIRSEVAEKVIRVLVEHGVNLESLLLGLAEYTHSQGLQKVTYRLEQAMSAYEKTTLVDSRNLESLNE